MVDVAVMYTLAIKRDYEQLLVCRGTWMNGPETINSLQVLRGFPVLLVLSPWRRVF